MSEEKKIVEIVENFIKYYKKNEQTGNRANLDVLREECNAIEFILNKYDIQQEELKQEKEKNKKIEEKIMEQDLMIDGLKENRRIAVEEIQEQYYVSKDKIKEIIDKIDAEDYYCLNEAEEDLRKLVE